MYFLKNSDIDFDKFNLRGSGLLLQTLMQTFASNGYGLVEINANDFFGTVDNLAKVNYLISRGLKSKVEDGKYDFSGLATENVKDAAENSEQNVLSFEISSSSESGEGECVRIYF